MRNVFLVGAAVAVAYLVVNRALLLLNMTNDLAVTGGYVLLLALVSALAGLSSWLWRRL